MQICVIGGGIVGLATVLQLRRRQPGANLILLEKEPGFGRHQSTHNSGVLHAGLYYKPGSVKARMAVNGIRLLTEYCRTNGIAHEICGKLVIAVDAPEVARLRSLHERGRQNGLSGLEWLEGGAIREIEPNVAGLAALRVPEEGIVDYAAVIQAMVSEARSLGVALHSGAGVKCDPGDSPRRLSKDRCEPGRPVGCRDLSGPLAIHGQESVDVLGGGASLLEQAPLLRLA